MAASSIATEVGTTSCVAICIVATEASIVVVYSCKVSRSFGKVSIQIGCKAAVYKAIKIAAVKKA